MASVSRLRTATRCCLRSRPRCGWSIPSPTAWRAAWSPCGGGYTARSERGTAPRVTTFSWRLGDLALTGWSRAGDASWFRVQPPGLALDAGRGAQELVGARDVFLTHGHLDHALGVPWLVSQRTRHRFENTRIFCP